MVHDMSTLSTTYVIVCSPHHTRNEIVKERLQDIFDGNTGRRTPTTNLQDPFLLGLLITQEAFIEAKTIITSLRYTLYDQLDRVDAYSKTSQSKRGRNELEELTIQLHVASQETDSHFASADMTAMILRRMLSAHNRYLAAIEAGCRKSAFMRTTCAIEYLYASVESQMRWLNSYKSRKDIAMNLVSDLLVLSARKHRSNQI